MTQQITLIKDKILSDNYFTLHNITYDLTRKDGEVIRHMWGSDQFWAELVQPGRTCKPCVARGVVI